MKNNYTTFSRVQLRNHTAYNDERKKTTNR